jgi:dTDP-4-dehydrorhamnose reductase
MKHKIGIIGCGMLGKELEMFFQLLDNDYYIITPYPHFKYDICDVHTVDKICQENDIIVNCAAYTNVDLAENEKADLCWQVNAFAVSNLAKLCKKYNKKLIHISTDFVYGQNHYPEWELPRNTESSECNPVNNYGKTKLEGENYIINTLDQEQYLILRVSWTFGKFGNNFISKIVKQLLDPKVKKLSAPADQIGRPTSTKTICKIILEYIHNVLPGGIYNVQNDGWFISKLHLAEYIANKLKIYKPIKSIYNIDLLNAGGARRPYNSKLEIIKLEKYLCQEIPNWKQEVNEYLAFLMSIHKPKNILQKLLEKFKK